MMADAPHDKEKKKGKPGYSLWIWTKRLLLAMAILLMIPVLLILLLMIAARFKSPYLDAQQVAKTCERLALAPDSEFCATPAKQTTETLRNTLEQAYPVGSVTIPQLKRHFKNLNCPARWYKSCSVELPVQWYKLSIDYDEDGRIERYSIFHLGL